MSFLDERTVCNYSMYVAIDFTCFCKNVQANGVSLHTFLARYAVKIFEATVNPVMTLKLEWNAWSLHHAKFKTTAGIPLADYGHIENGHRVDICFVFLVGVSPVLRLGQRIDFKPSIRSCLKTSFRLGILFYNFFLKASYAMSWWKSYRLYIYVYIMFREAIRNAKM